MEKTSMENLGLTSELNGWESEKQEREVTLGKINKLKEQAYLRALREKRRMDSQNMPANFPKELIE